MTARAGGWGTGLALAACLVFPLLAHCVVTGRLGEGLRAALVALPLLALATWAVVRAGSRPFWLAALALTGAAVALPGHAGLGLAAAYGIPHAAVHAFLLALFARTLRPGREPMVTAIARRIHGTLEPEIVAYTRNVTIAWCGFFAAQIAVSIALYALAPVEAWSLFVNVLNVPLIALMFGAEYAWRITRYPDHPRASLASTVRAFARSG